ncbi:hypothetical protein [Actinoplanes nipponensis]|uniref:hypothetical protein n=1 Tax=Actinoplanes nipponensis TaxID=135950 RepID=UPI0031E7141B
MPIRPADTSTASNSSVQARYSTPGRSARIRSRSVIAVSRSIHQCRPPGPTSSTAITMSAIGGRSWSPPWVPVEIAPASV